LIQSPVQLAGRDIEELCRFRLGNRTFRQYAKTKPLQARWLLRRRSNGSRLFIGSTAPAACLKQIEQLLEQSAVDDPQVATAVRDRLQACAEELLQTPQFAQADCRTVFAYF